MGMDPVQQGEMWEVTVQLDGKVTAKAFKEYRKELMAFIDKLNAIVVDHTTKPPTLLQARESRESVRAKAQ
jgi:hypothetical protein